MATVSFSAADEVQTPGIEAANRNKFDKSCIRDLRASDLSKGRVHDRDGRQTAVEPAAARADGSHHRARRGARSRGAGAPGAARIRRRAQGEGVAMSSRQVISELTLE